MFKRIMLGVLASLVTVFSIGAIRSYRTNGSAEWQEAEATITDSTILTIFEKGAKDLKSGKRSVAITYKFHADGQQYTSSQVSNDENPQPMSQQAAMGLASRFPVRGQVPVYYETDNPRNSFLEKSSAGSLMGKGPIRGLRFVLGILGLSTYLWYLTFNGPRGPKYHHSVRHGISFHPPKGWKLTADCDNSHCIASGKGMAFRLNWVAHARTFPSNKSLIQERVEQLENVYDQVKILSNHPATMGGFEGHHARFAFRDGNGKSIIECFARGHRGMELEGLLFVQARKMSAKQSLALLQKLMSGVHQDKDKLTSACTEPKAREMIETSLHTFQFSRSSSQWRSPRKSGSQRELFDIQLSHRAGLICDLSSVLLPQVNFSFESVCEGLLSFYEFTLADHHLITVKNSPGKARHYRIQRTQHDQEYEYQFLLQVKDNVAYAFFVSAETENPHIESCVEDLSDCISLTPSKAPSFNEAHFDEHTKQR